jgi:hypothetical protein
MQPMLHSERPYAMAARALGLRTLPLQPDPEAWPLRDAAGRCLYQVRSLPATARRPPGAHCCA